MECAACGHLEGTHRDVNGTCSALCDCHGFVSPERQAEVREDEDDDEAKEEPFDESEGDLDFDDEDEDEEDEGYHFDFKGGEPDDATMQHYANNDDEGSEED